MLFRRVCPGYEVTTVEDALPVADVYVTTTGNKDIITADHMSKDERSGDRL